LSSPTSADEPVRIIGITGSIGMGKSTAAAMFRERGIPLHDSDAAVHRLYRGAAVASLEAAFPGVTKEDAVDRASLSQRVVGDPAALARLEAIVHPLVAESEAVFLERCRREGRRLALIDVPLLFETGRAAEVDIVVVVSAPAGIQRARVLSRPQMTQEKFETLLMRQTPDAEKRRRAHFVIDSGREREFASRQVEAILNALAGIA
jgi:dephospho-CoA kinase